LKVRRLIIAVHRDLGYFFAGLTVMYAISGVAVNHIADWNPNYRVGTEVVEIGSLPEVANDQLVAEVLGRLGIDGAPINVVRMGPEELKIFFEGRTLTVGLHGGRVVDEQVSQRPFFYQLNFLHLNHGKGIWTWLADVYAVGLLVLASTGIFIITGRKGLGGRGRWLLLAGLAIPLAYLIAKG